MDSATTQAEIATVLIVAEGYVQASRAVLERLAACGVDDATLVPAHAGLDQLQAAITQGRRRLAPHLQTAMLTRAAPSGMRHTAPIERHRPTSNNAGG